MLHCFILSTASGSGVFFCFDVGFDKKPRQLFVPESTRKRTADKDNETVAQQPVKGKSGWGYEQGVGGLTVTNGVFTVSFHLIHCLHSALLSWCLTTMIISGPSPRL